MTVLVYEAEPSAAAATTTVRAAAAAEAAVAFIDSDLCAPAWDFAAVALAAGAAALF